MPASLKAAGPGRFRLAGSLGFDEAPRILQEGEAAFGPLAEAEVDLGGLERADSAGLAVLLEWALAARASGRQVRYRNVPAPLASLAGVSGADEMLASGGGDGSPESG